MGGIGVGVFFMLSAYGLLKSSEKHQFNYIKRLLIKIAKLYLIQVVVNLIYYLVFRPSDTAVNIALRIFNLDIFFGLGRMNVYSWFITTILICYILFLFVIIASKLIKDGHKKLFVSITTSALIIAFYIVQLFTPLESLYVRSILCFILGIMLFLFEKSLFDLLSDRLMYIVSLVSLIVLVVISNMLLPELFVSLFVCMLIIVISRHLSFGGSTVGLFIGEISLGMYLFQLMFFNLIDVPKGMLYYFLGVFGATVVVSYIAHNVVKAIEKILSLIARRIKDKKSLQQEDTQSNSIEGH